MDFVRTPDSRFASLSGWPYSPHYTQIDAADGSGVSLRVAHIDEGKHDARETILCMHGEPSWSYLYRGMVAPFVNAGHRVIAPDLVGFGRSDKPTQTSDYTYERHVDWMCQWFEANEFDNVTLVCQDWGGLIGLRIATAFPEHFARLVVANTALPLADREPSEAFRAWQKYSQEVPVFDVGKMVSSACVNKLSPEEIFAYDAPFPDESYKAAARIFPSLYPDGVDHPSNIANSRAWDVLRAFTKPVLTAFSDGDPITRGGHKLFQSDIPGAHGQPHVIVKDAGHFLQEDQPVELATIINQFMSATA